jgi:hypothetical protein
MACRGALEIDEGRAIRDDVLHVLHIGDIEARIENLACDPFRDREPDLAVEAHRRSYSKLVSGCP